jgi:aldose 1-epimerase
METIRISDGLAEAVVLPGMGAALASYDLIVDGHREPLFRPCRDLSKPSFIDLANFNMIPWSGRIAGGGFSANGQFHPMKANMDGQKHPIHGNGFQLPWTFAMASETAVVMTLNAKGPGPFAYDAAFEYRLEAGALTMAMTMINRAATALPYGGGFHPWLPREPGMTLQANVQRRVIKDAEILPIGVVPVGDDPTRDFRQPIPFPTDLLDTDYLDWDGLATVRWTKRGLALAIDATADPHLRTCVVYSPGAHVDFFCFEPVNHRSGAHTLPGGPEANGLVMLPPGERLTLTCVYRPSREGKTV